jgi:hypothetical protein
MCWKAEGALPAVFFSDADEVEGRTQVQACEEAGLVRRLEDLLDARQRVMPTLCDRVDGTIVDDWAEGRVAVLLRDEHEWGSNGRL